MLSGLPLSNFFSEIAVCTKHALTILANWFMAADALPLLSGAKKSSTYLSMGIFKILLAMAQRRDPCRHASVNNYMYVFIVQ